MDFGEIVTGLSRFFYFKTVPLGNVSQRATIDKRSVALTILRAVVFLGEILSLKTATGAAFILTGTLVLIVK